METAERFAARRDVVLDVLAGQHACEGILVTGSANVRYLCGFSGSHGSLLLLAGRAELITDFRYLEQAHQECPGVEIVEARGSRRFGVERGLEAADRLAVEAEHLSLADWLALTTGHWGERLVPTTDVVEGARMVKDHTEIAQIERACEIAQAALLQVVARTTVGQTERQFASDLEWQMRQGGADGVAFPSIVASGPHSAIPHHSPTDRQFTAGDLLKVDFGAMVGGYHSDITRTFVVAAEPTDWQREIHDLVDHAAATGRAMVRAGRSVADLDGAVRGMIAQAGHGEHFGHGLGHGVGLQIHEAPIMGPSSAGTLDTAMTITVEPGVYLPSRGGVRIEDTVVVGPESCRCLTTLDRGLLRVG